MKDLLKSLLSFGRSQNSKLPPGSRILFGKYDSPSVQDSVDKHIESFGAGEDMKQYSSSDKELWKIARNVVTQTKYRDAPSSAIGSAKAQNFFTEKILKQPSNSFSEVGSIKVKLSAVEDFPQFKSAYEKFKNQNVMFCIGGPAAEDQVVLACIIESLRSKLDGIFYIIRDYVESNIAHSAKQLHARHGNRLSADDELSGHKLAPILFMRKLLGVSLNEVLEPDYKKIDIKFDISPRKLRIYFGNELNWLKQKYRVMMGQLADHDVSRIESVLAQQILITIEEVTGVALSGGLKRAEKDSASIHVNFTKEGDIHTQKEHKEFEKIGIESKKLDEEKLRFIFGNNSEIYSVYEYLGDGSAEFDIHEKNKQIAKSRGAKWFEGKEINRVLLVKNDQGVAEIAGVVDSKGEYHYCNKLHFTGGYKVEYEFDRESASRFQSNSFLRNALNKVEDIFGWQPPVSSQITTATGVSINAVFRRSERLDRIIKKYGSTGELAVTNGHWTMIACDNNYIIMRITGGGNTGSEEYNPAYFLNILANTRRIFGDDLIGILSAYGCPRAVNAKNSTEFSKIAEGFVASYGKGGTGNTKRHAEAAFGAMMLGFDKEIIDYFQQFQHKNGKNLGEELLESYEVANKIGFIHDESAKTGRRMGYDESLSLQEKFMMVCVLTALSSGLAKGVFGNQDKSESNSR
jgi:hypothetical protein